MSPLPPTLAAILSLLLAAPLSLSAADIIKADNTDPLQNTTSWTGGIAPTVTDAAVWNGSLTTNFSSTLSSAATWGGIKITDISNALTIDLNAALSLGDATANLGIDMSTATQDVLIRSTSSQTINWSVNPLLVNIASGRTLTIDAKFGASDLFHKNGEGTLILQGNNDNGGTVVVVNAGTLVLAKTSSASNHALGGGTHAINGGTMRLAGTGDDQIYMTASVNISSGTLDFNGRNEGWGRLDGLAAGTITNTAATASIMTIGETNANNAVFAGVISNGVGGLSVIKTGTGIQTFTSTANTYAGGTTINGGVLSIADDGTLGAASGQVNLSNGGVLMNHSSSPATLTTARQINIDATGGGIRAGHTRNISVTGKITGAGGLRIQNDNGYVILSSTTNDYAGTTTIGGTVNGNGTIARLMLGANEVLPNNTDVVFDAGGTTNTATLNLNGRTETVRSLSTISGVGLIISTNGVDSATIANSKLNINGSATTTFTGSLGNNIHLEHQGTGQLTLSGTGDNSGLRITVSGGTLLLAKTSTASNHALGGATHTINNGGTLKLGGTGNDQIYFGSTVQINTGGTFDFGGVEFEDVNYISGSGLVTNNTATSTSRLVLGTNVATTSVNAFSGQINNGAGTMALEKNGVNTLVLTGNSNFTGGTVVNAGTLGGTGTIGSGLLTVKSGATLSPGATTTDAFSLGAGILTIGGPVTLEGGSNLTVNLALGGNAAQTDRVKLLGALALEGSNLNVVWGGTASNLYNGTLSSSNMFWITEGATSLTGLFSNFGPIDDWGMFGAAEYARATISGQEYALFYNSQFGQYNFSGLTGGNDLLLIAVPEPSRLVLLSFAFGTLLFRRRRCSK